MIFHDQPHTDILQLNTGLPFIQESIETDDLTKISREDIFITYRSKLRSDMVIPKDSLQQIGLIVDVDPQLVPFLIVKRCWYSGPFGSFQYRYFLGFNGPKDLAIMWKLSL